MCSWSNTQNIKLDKLDWELTSQEAEQHYSTPAEDHTLGTEKGEAGRDKVCSCILIIPVIDSCLHE